MVDIYLPSILKIFAHWVKRAAFWVFALPPAYAKIKNYSFRELETGEITMPEKSGKSSSVSVGGGAVATH